MADRGAPAGGRADAEVDALGLLCPLPVLRAEAALRRLPPGGVLCLLADDERVRQDLRDWCDGNGHELLGFEPLPPAAAASSRPALRCWVRRGTPRP